MNSSMPLHNAIIEKAEESIIQQLHLGLDPNVADEYNRKPLHLALENNCSDSIVEALLLAGARADYEVLMLGISHFYNANIILKLLQHGAQAKETDYLGNNGLHRAGYTYKYNNIEVIELLIQNGADVNQKANCQIAPLYPAIDVKNILLIEILLQYGANPCQEFEYNPKTPLELSFNFPPPVVENLIKYASLQVNHTDDEEMHKFFQYFLSGANGRKFLKFAQQCMAEINILKRHQLIEKSVSLFDFIISQGDNLKSLSGQRVVINGIFTSLAKSLFTIYVEVIIKKLERSVILNKVLEYSANMDVLDTYSMEFVAKYLPKTDLGNICIAFSSVL